ncbi:T9SS type A sorting domain-containing protein [Maribacter luteus]|uniref:T9SS type A sorting domain-containing protein n=1 Tax=Maribacter luteus TaxID=2594478 RepID=UPI002493236D|nr:T9SS type A sorting domain-containing protein [Maribacter luteus]
MKRFMKISLSFAFLFVSALGMANEMDLRISTDKESKTLLFKYDNSTTDAELRFVDGEGNVIFTESLEDNAEYSKKFNLSTLKAGIYFLEVEDAVKETAYTISIGDTNVAIENRLEKNKPVFSEKEGMVYLNLLNLNKEEVVITVYDDSERTVANEIMENQAIVEKAFNFKIAHKGQYIIKVKKGSDTFYNSIKID